MKKRAGMIGRFILSLLLICALFLPLFTVNAKAATKEQKTHAISIVFDNSGSMYGLNGSDNQAWCRALYSIEVFLSLANKGDNIWIYPMNEATVKGQTYDMDTPLKIEAGGDTTAIRELITPDIDNYTPLESITKAADGLKSIPGDEKWLVVLTDGEKFHIKNESDNYQAMSAQETTAQLTTTLSELNDQYNVMYLGVGAKAAEPEITSTRGLVNDVKVARNSSDVQAYLTQMSNTIFGRDELEISGNSVAFDITMNKLVIVVQGSGISDLKLLTSGGSEAGTKTSQYSPKYSEKTCGEQAKIDESLSGMIISYEGLEEGNYTLSYNGNAESIGVYYEPEVGIMAYLTDVYGNTVTDYAAVYPGDYKLHYGLVDKNNKLVDSPLLGKKEFNVDYTVDGEHNKSTSNENSAVDISLKEGSTIDAQIDATYLSGYHVSVAASEFGWPQGGIVCVAREAGSLDVSLSGGQDKYPADQLEEQGIYDVKVYFEGTPITGEDLERVTLNPSFDGAGSLAYETEINEAKDGLKLKLKHPGEPAATPTGKYQMGLSADYLDEFDVKASASASPVNFKIEEVEESLKVAMAKAKTYQTVSEAKKEDVPIVFEVSKNGQPLTAAELNALKLDIDASGLNYKTELDPENSQVKVHILPDENLKPGKYKITAKATARDSLGREISDDDKMVAQYGTIPRWLQLLIGLIILALLLLLFLLFMNQKILPKDMRAGKTKFTLDGDEVSGTARCTFSGKKKKNGRLEILSPRCVTNPTAKCGVVLTLLADSPRRQKSSTRKAIVTGVQPLNGQNIRSIQIAGASFIKDEETGKFKPARGGAKASMDNLAIRLTSGSRVTINGEAMDPDGGSSDMSFNVTLKYF